MEKKPKKTRKEKRQEEQRELEKKIKELYKGLTDAVGDDSIDIDKIVPTSKDLEAIRIVEKWQIVINILTILAVTGFLKWFEYSNIYMVFIIMLIIAVLDYIVGLIINRNLFNTLFYTLGLIKLAPSAFGFASAYFLPGIKVISFWKLLLAFVLYNILRKVVSVVFKRFLKQRGEGK